MEASANLRPVRMAFKEWSAVVDALEQGRQILVLRKGGLAEGRRGFEVGFDRFWLFPTWYHKQEEGLLPDGAARFRAMLPGAPAEDRVRISSFAEIVDWRRLESEADVGRLRGFHGWRDEIVADRFRWGGEQGLFALAVRVWRLPAAELPVRPEYGGCRSWIELVEPPAESGATPALDDASFGVRLTELRGAWGTA
jgi:hypothetical protein